MNRRAYAFALLASLAACGDDSGSESGDIPETPKFSELKLPFSDSPGCLSTESKKHGDTSPQTTCRCNACLQYMQECEAVPGCIEIMACANRTGCRDATTCYLLPGAMCATTIDNWGNSSLATAIALDIMTCSNSNGCF